MAGQRRWAAPGRGARDLARLLFGPGPAAIPLGSRFQVHRALAASVLALLLSALVAGLARVGLPPSDPSLEWYGGYGFLDERWLVLGYWLAVASTVCVPLLVMRERAWWPADSVEADAWAPRLWLALAAYALWLGPPWNLELLPRAMEWHELVHLGPLQAVLAGKDFYLESGTQYGPGLQMLSVQYVEHFGVSLLAFREFWMWTSFLSGLVIVGWMARSFPVPALIVGLLVLRFFSPLRSLSPTDAGSYDFFFGWASLARGAGAIHATFAVATVLSRVAPEGSATSSGERLFLLVSGIVWGLFVLFAQENLGCGLAALGLLTAYVLITRAVPFSRLASAGLAFGFGAALGVAPLVLLFSAAGELDAFLARYFEIGSYVVKGYSGSTFSGPWLSPQGVLYALVPLAAVLLFAVAGFDRSRDRRWRMLAAAAAATTLASFAVALLRTDTNHIMSSLLPLGFLAAAAVAGLRAPSARPASTLVLAIALLPLIFALRPSHARVLMNDASGRVRSYTVEASEASRVAARVGYQYDLDAPYAVFSELPLGEFLTLSNAIHEKVRGRPVVVSSAIGHRGYWYFFADLLPHAADPEPSMTIVNSRLRERYLAELLDRGIPCVVSTSPQDAEVEIFRRQPGERDEWILETSERNFFVGCMRQALARG